MTSKNRPSLKILLKKKKAEINQISAFVVA